MLTTIAPQLILTASIEKDPGAIIGPISAVLGFLINLVFEGVSFIMGSQAHVLGISIILFTIITRLIMLPLGFKQQKSTANMQKIQPEMDKIKAKYGDTKDPELKNKMNAEISALYSKNNVNMFSGCLPMLLQLPIFFALSYVMRQTYLFVDNVGAVYEQLAVYIQMIPDYSKEGGEFFNLCVPMVPNGMSVLLSDLNDLQRFINKFSADDWAYIFSLIEDPTLLANIKDAYQHKVLVETFLGIDLIAYAGTSWPGIMIPILSVISSGLSSWLSTKTNPSSDPQAKNQQRIMMIVTTAMMGYFTITVPAGVGIYWITGSIYQVAQQFLLSKFYRTGKKEVAK